MSITHSLVALSGMGGAAHSYHVHLIPVQPMLEFPCTGEAVGGHFNPWQVDSTSLVGKVGTEDQYEVGDLSGKYGDLKEKTGMSVSVVDNGITLYGPLR